MGSINPYTYSFPGTLFLEGRIYPILKKEGPLIIFTEKFKGKKTNSYNYNEKTIVFQLYNENHFSFSKYQKLGRVKIILKRTKEEVDSMLPFTEGKVLYVASLKVFGSNNKGCGAALMRLAIQESISSCNGKIALNSINGSGGFYVKVLQFECIDSARQQQIVDTLSKSKEAKIDGGMMYLPLTKVSEEVAKLKNVFKETNPYQMV